jgi:hypothetical protein
MNYLKNISKSVIVIVSLFATLVAFGTYEKRQASKASAAFCNSVAINSPDNGIKEKAISFGADPRMSVFFIDDNNQHKFIAAFHGFLCLIAAYAKSQRRIILCDLSNSGG